MLKTLHIRNFRGIESLDIEDLGRVNLLIGRNNSGKTSVMEAAILAHEGPAGVQIGAWSRKESPRTPNPLLFLIRAAADSRQFEVWGDDVNAPLIGREGRKYSLVLSWGGKEYLAGWEDGGPSGEELIDLVEERGTSSSWGSQDEASLSGAVRRFTELYREGREHLVRTVLQHVAPDLESLDLIGEDVWYKLAHSRPRLPLATLGDGALWLFDVAVALSDEDYGCLCLDELDAGLHHSALVQMLTMLRTSRPDLQIFATTHSDECIRAACEVFRDADDPGLRIIRLDRTEFGHRAAIYDRDTALLALENGWEIRG